MEYTVEKSGHVSFTVTKHSLPIKYPKYWLNTEDTVDESDNFSFTVTKHFGN